MYCGKCGRQIAEGDKFCSNCGNTLMQTSQDSKNIIGNESNQTLQSSDQRKRMSTSKILWITWVSCAILSLFTSLLVLPAFGLFIAAAIQSMHERNITFGKIISRLRENIIMQKKNLALVTIGLVFVIAIGSCLHSRNVKGSGDIPNGTYVNSEQGTVVVEDNTMLVDDGYGYGSVERFTYEIDGDEIIIIDEDGRDDVGSYEKINDNSFMMDDYLFIKK